MKAATLHEIKKELETYHPQRLKKLCLRLGRFKLENKELLSYLLFESENEDFYISNLKEEMEELFNQLNRSTFYRTKKGLRRIIKHIDKHIRYSGNKETETQIRLYYCQLMIDSQIPTHRSKVLKNIYDRQIEKIHKSIAKLHEDLQYDYKDALTQLK